MEDKLFDRICAIRLSLMDTYYDEKMIIKNIKINLHKYDGIETEDELNKMIIDFYKEYNIDITTINLDELKVVGIEHQENTSNNPELLLDNIISLLNNHGNNTNGLQNPFFTSFNLNSLNSTNINNLDEIEGTYDDAEDADDNEDSNNEDSDNEDVNDSDNEDSDNEDSDNEDSDNDDVDNEDYATNQSGIDENTFLDETYDANYPPTLSYTSYYNAGYQPLNSTSTLNPNPFSDVMFNFLNNTPTNESSDQFLNAFNALISNSMQNYSTENFEDIKVTLEDDEVNNIKEISYIKKEDKVEQCTICLAEFKENDLINELPCCHSFHPECIKEWLKEYDYKCPVCRKECGKPKYHV